MSARSPSPLVAPIIVNWNRERLTLATLASLGEQRYPRLLPIVVDNGSANQGETLDSVRRAHPGVRTIASPQNLGYAGGCNLGLRLAMDEGAEYPLFLNNDVRLDPDAIAELVAALEADPAAAAAGPLIYYASAPDIVWFGGGTVAMGARVMQRHEGQGERDGQRDTGAPRTTQWLTGTAIMARRQCIETVGSLDATYFLYWEDVDWSYRLRRAGYRLLVVPRARLWHQVNASSDRPAALQYYWERNRLLFTERWGGRSARLMALGKVLLRLSAWRLAGARTPRAHVRQQAYRDYLRRRFGRRVEPPSEASPLEENDDRARVVR